MFNYTVLINYSWRFNYTV